MDPLFGTKQMVQWEGNSKESKDLRVKKSKQIKQLIVTYLRCIIDWVQFTFFYLTVKLSK